jgi:hypothetical protein
MTMPNTWALMFFRHKDLFEAKSYGESWLSIGTLDYEVTPDVEERLGFAGSCNSLFEKLGYTQYKSLDINIQADIALDLNTPIKDHHGEFDVIYDGGSVEHIINPVQGCINLLKMAKLGGRIIHSQGVGDQMGHGYWTFSPEFLKDFYTANGCKLRGMFLMDVHGNEYPVERQKNGMVGLLGCIPNKIRRKIGIHIVKNSFNLPYDPMITNYSLIAVFEKLKEVKSISMPMQGQYAGDSVLDTAATL